MHQLPAIVRPGEVENLAGRKIRDVSRGASVEWLRPNVGDTLLVANVGQLACILGPPDVDGMTHIPEWR